jgi:3-oxoacyl-[acyl-carrier-protein] synthase III
MADPRVHIRSIGTALPGPPIDNAGLARHFKMTASFAQWIDTYVGTSFRHFAFDLDTGKREYSLADLGAEAGGRAIANAGIEPGQLDLIVMATWSPDQLIPATVNIVADRLGVNDLATFQLQSGCTGALQALDVAGQLLIAGRHRTALVIGADTCFKHFRPGLDLRRMEPGHLVNTVLFGDGAGAAVLSRDPAPGAPLLRHVAVRLTGLNRAPGQSADWFGWGDTLPDHLPIAEDYKAIEESVPAMAVEVFHELLEELDWSVEDADYLLPPQLSGQMTERITGLLDVAGLQEISCVRETGNMGNALPFFQLELLLPRMTAGDRALGVAIESSKWIKAGFAVEMP